MTATSSSDRIQAARKALRWHDDPMATPNADRLADALRALIEPPATTDNIDKLTMDTYMEVHSFPVPIDGDNMRDLIRRGIVAGIQAAWESWEPETANVEPDAPEDSRIRAWHQIADHPFFEECYDSEAPLIETMIAKLDRTTTESEKSA